jgi:hypothetical protein
MDGAAAGATGDIPDAEGEGPARKPPPKQSLSGAPSRVKLDAVGRATRPPADHFHMRSLNAVHPRSHPNHIFHCALSFF